MKSNEKCEIKTKERIKVFGLGNIVIAWNWIHFHTPKMTLKGEHKAKKEGVEQRNETFQSFFIKFQ